MPVRSADVSCRTTNRSKLVVAWRHEKFSPRPEEKKRYVWLICYYVDNSIDISKIIYLSIYLSIYMEISFGTYSITGGF